MSSLRAVVCLSPRNRTLAFSLSLYLSYAVLISLFAPFMVRRVGAAPAAAVGKAVASLASPGSMPARNARHRDGELIIRFRESASEQDKNTLLAAKKARRIKKLRGTSRLEKLRIEDGQDAQSMAAELRQNPLVELAEPNYLIGRDQTVPDDQQFGEQWALRNTGQNNGQVGADISASLAWETTTGPPSPTILKVTWGRSGSREPTTRESSRPSCGRKSPTTR